MSVILEALQKARREKLQEGYDRHDVFDQATAPGAKSGRSVKRRLLWVGVILLATGGGALATQYVMTHPDQVSGWRARIAGFSKPPVAVGPAVPKAPVVEANSRVPATTTGSQEAEVHFPDGKVVKLSAPLPPTGATPALPVSVDPSGAGELPAPVPLTALSPEASQSLPPPPRVQPEKPASKSGFTLSAILCDDNQRMAIINGHTVREGQTYSGFRVLQITPNQVTIQPNGREPLTLAQY